MRRILHIYVCMYLCIRLSNKPKCSRTGFHRDLPFYYYYFVIICLVILLIANRCAFHAEARTTHPTSFPRLWFGGQFTTYCQDSLINSDEPFYRIYGTIFEGINTSSFTIHIYVYFTFSRHPFFQHFYALPSINMFYVYLPHIFSVTFFIVTLH
jgi:hypothetical protein